MSHDTLDAPTTQEPRPTSRRDGSQVSVKDGLLTVYRFLHNKRTGLVLILAMAVLTLLGVLFQQVPPEVKADPQAWADWLAEVRPRYRGWTTPLSVLGVFNVFSSLVFKVVTVLLALSILACTCHRTPLLWRQATRPHTHVRDGFFTHSRLHTAVAVPASTADALEQARRELRRQRYRVIDDAHDGLYADRFRFAPFGTVIAHLAFVVILIGVLVSGGAGFRDNGFAVAVGSTRDVGHGTDLSVRVDGFQDTYDESGRPIDYVADVVLFDDGEQVAQQQVRVNQPLRYDGIKFNQSYFGTAAQLRVTGTDGTLFDSGVPMEWTTPDEVNTYGKFTLQSEGIEVYVIGVASGQSDPQVAPGQIRIEIYPIDSNEPMGTQVLTQGEPVTVGGLDYTFQREAKYTALMVSKDPGALWVWVGAALIVFGTCLSMFFRHHRIWVRAHSTADGTELAFASPDKKDVAFESRFFRVAAQVQSALAAPTRHDTPTTGKAQV